MPKAVYDADIMKQYNNILANNKKHFKAGAVMSRTTFTTLFGLAFLPTKGTYEKVHKGNMKLVQVQNMVNKLLAKNGLKLRSRNYYKEFYVTDLQGTKAAIKRTSASIDRMQASINTMEQAIVERQEEGSWGRFRKVKKKELAELCEQQVPNRHEACVSRIDRL